MREPERSSGAKSGRSSSAAPGPSSEAAAGRTITVSRTLAAGREVVFDALTRADELQRWWAPVPGIVTDVQELDLRVGGRYRLTMHVPDGSVISIEGEYREIERPERLVFTWNAPCAGVQVVDTVVTIELGDRRGRTELTLTHSGFPESKVAGQHWEGWVEKMDYLQRHLSA